MHPSKEHYLDKLYTAKVANKGAANILAMGHMTAAQQTQLGANDDD